MHKEVLTKFGLENGWMPITALIIFATCFALFTYWTLKKENKSHYEEAGTLPLTDGVSNEQR